jgi:hypothetical protein
MSRILYDLRSDFSLEISELKSVYVVKMENGILCPYKTFVKINILCISMFMILEILRHENTSRSAAKSLLSVGSLDRSNDENKRIMEQLFKNLHTV